MKTYFRLLTYAKPIEKYALPYTFYTLLSVFFSTLNLALIIPLLNTLFLVHEANTVVHQPTTWTDILGYFNYYVYHFNQQYGTYGTLKRVLIGIVFSVLVSNLFRYLSQRVMENLRIHTLLNLRKAVFNNVMNLHVGYFNSQRKGDIISKVATDVSVVQFSVTSTLQVVFKEPLQLLFYIISLFAISVKLTLFAVLVIPVSAFVISLIVKKLKSQAQESQEVQGEMISYLDEALTGIKVIKAFNATSYVKERFHAANLRLSTLGRRMARRQQMGSPVSELLGVMMVALLVLYGGSLVLSGSTELGAASFIGYIAIFSQVMRPAKALTESFSNIHSGIAAGERVLKLIDEKTKIEEPVPAVAIDGFKDKISFNQVDFSYADRKILSQITFDIKKGQLVALVGPSGGGKSTLMDLLPKFIVPERGTITLDGIDFQQIASDSLRQLMGTVTQESVLFNDTVLNNIAFGAGTVSKEEVVAAAKIANAHEFISAMSEGYDTNIGDRGIKLSGGQRQRLCIARAILKNPPILLLDEATSALDTESEKLVQEALNRLMQTRTTLVIAHRLSTIQHADLILVIDNGQVLERGTHQDLLEADGLYRRLVGMQQFENPLE